VISEWNMYEGSEDVVRVVSDEVGVRSVSVVVGECSGRKSILSCTKLEFSIYKQCHVTCTIKKDDLFRPSTHDTCVRNNQLGNVLCCVEDMNQDQQPQSLSLAPPTAIPFHCAIDVKSDILIDAAVNRLGPSRHAHVCEGPFVVTDFLVFPDHLAYYHLRPLKKDIKNKDAGEAAVASSIGVYIEFRDCYNREKARALTRSLQFGTILQSFTYWQLHLPALTRYPSDRRADDHQATWVLADITLAEEQTEPIYFQLPGRDPSPQAMYDRFHLRRICLLPEQREMLLRVTDDTERFLVASTSHDRERGRPVVNEAGDLLIIRLAPDLSAKQIMYRNVLTGRERVCYEQDANTLRDIVAKLHPNDDDNTNSMPVWVRDFYNRWLHASSNDSFVTFGVAVEGKLCSVWDK